MIIYSMATAETLAARFLDSFAATLAAPLASSRSLPLAPLAPPTHPLPLVKKSSSLLSGFKSFCTDKSEVLVEKVGVKKRRGGIQNVKKWDQPASTPTQWCDICKISLNASLQMEQHFAGKSHAKRLKVALRGSDELIRSSAEEELGDVDVSPVPADILVRRLIDANAPRGENGKLRCDLCSVTMPSAQVAQTHFGGKKHRKKLEALKEGAVKLDETLEAASADVTRPGGAGSQVTVVRALDPSRRSPESRLDPTDSRPRDYCPSIPRPPPVKFRPTVPAFRCDVCRVTMTSLTQLTQHQSGLKHLKRVAKSSLGREPVLEGDCCGRCRRTPAGLEKHETL